MRMCFVNPRVCLILLSSVLLQCRRPCLVLPCRVLSHPVTSRFHFLSCHRLASFSFISGLSCFLLSRVLSRKCFVFCPVSFYLASGLSCLVPSCACLLCLSCVFAGLYLVLLLVFPYMVLLLFCSSQVFFSFFSVCLSQSLCAFALI